LIGWHADAALRKDLFADLGERSGELRINSAD
jgi:hypothetical protein